MEETCWYDTMGNLNDVTDFMEIWNSPKAAEVREKVAHCSKSCWMIGSASPVMRKYIRHIMPWVIKNKWASLCGKKVDVPFYHVGHNDEQGIR